VSSSTAIVAETPENWRRRLGHWAQGESLLQHEDKILLLLTLIIGALVGLVVAAFIYVTEDLGARMYPAGGAAWRRVLIPTGGALLTGYLLSRFFTNARGSGIPQTKAALFLRDGFISMRTVLGKFGCCSAALASGIALGREGPSVQVGAGIASILGRRLGLGPDRIRELIPVGSAAALAAAFNTPVAAVLFTLEEVMGDLHAPVLGSIVLGSATSWVTLHLLLGDEPLFHVPSYQLVSPIEFIGYAVLGICGGLVSVVFVKLLLAIRKYCLGMPHWTEWFQPAMGGLAVGLMGWFVPDVLGVGYGHVSEALNGQMTLRVMAMLVVLKLIATTACYGTGNAGGIFGPSLFIGAMLGGAVGTLAHQILPDFTGGVGAYALVGMGALFAGVVRVPLTSVIMIFEMTRDYSIIVPLMISNLISFYISRRLQEEPIYEALQHQDGLHLPAGLRYRQGLLIVRDAAVAPLRVLSRTDRMEDALRFLDQDHDAWPVMEGGGRLAGVVTLAQVRKEIDAGHSDRTLGELLPVDVPTPLLTAENFPHVHMDHPLDMALRRMAHGKLNLLPVVGRMDIRDLKGVVSLNDILQAYGVAGEKGETRSATEVILTPRRLVPGVIAAGLAVLLVLGFLNYYYRADRTARAERYYKTGNELLRQNRDDEAVQQFRDALSAAPGTSQYRLALGLALVHANHPAEGAVYLDALLKRDPENALANLGEARLAAAEGNNADTAKLYRRAIDGSWPPGQEQNRMQARFELAALLEKSGRRTQAIAELLAALGPGEDTATRKKIGGLLLSYGAPREAADVFRNIILMDNRDANAYAGLGQAELALDSYQAAREAFQQALKWNPLDDQSNKRLQLSEQVLMLDPNERGLRVAQRFERSKELLRAEVMRFDQCQPGGKPRPDAQPASDAAALARKALANHPSRIELEDAAEMNLAIAGNLWKREQVLCGATANDYDAMARVLSRLSK
jgi:CIC family chloride channel protein